MGDWCEDNPVVSYYLMAEEEAVYTAEIWTSPSNPDILGEHLSLAMRNVSTGEPWKKADTVPENYRAGNPDDDFWAAGVIEQVHKTCVPISLRKGFNEVQIEILSKIPAVEKIIFYREGTIPRTSYMGPAESWKR